MSKASRRDFLKWSAASGAAATFSGGFWTSRARGEDYDGLCILSVTASGGWDPTFLTDPKSDPEINRVTTTVGTAGNITYADLPVDPVALEYGEDVAAEYAPYLMSNAAFFTKHASRLTVFNGVDTTTNNHEVGQRIVWSGRSLVGYPSLGALTSAALGPDLPLAYMSQGGYDHTANLVPLARVSDASAMVRLLHPNDVSAGEAETNHYHSSSTADRIARFRRERLARLAGSSTLPAERIALEDFERARESVGDLANLSIPSNLVSLPGVFGGLASMEQQAQIAMASFAAGTTVAAGVILGGFDTHATHDREQRRRLANLLAGIDFIVEEAERLGLSERLVIVVGSDFGRGPYYNGTNANAGKDHWSNTTMMVIVPPSMATQYGNRQIGASDEGVRSLAIDADNLEPNDAGVMLTPALIHQSLRRLLGIADTEVTQEFPLTTEELPLF